jgi:hypothetical protein
MGLSLVKKLSGSVMWGPKMKGPKSIDLSPEEMDALLERVAAGTLIEGDYEIIKAMAETIGLLSQSVDEKAASIKRLLRMLFGSSTEKARNVLKDEDKDESGSEASKRAPGDAEDDPVDNEDSPDKRKKGHGRNGAAAYTGADKILVPHSELKSGG